MRRSAVVFLVSVVVFSAAVAGVHAGEWRIPIGLSYVSGFDDIGDLHEANLQAEGNRVERIDTIPVGLTVHPYYEMDFGLGIGFGIGPTMMILGDTTMWNVPVGVDARFALPARFNVSPYVRGGIRYHIAGGDYVEDSKPGAFGGAGLVFLRNRKVGVGIEVAVDTSSVEFEVVGHMDTVEYEPAEVMVSIYAVL